METNLTRRQALAAATAGGAAMVVGGELLAADGVEQAFAAGACVVTPELTIGPYFKDEKLDRSTIREDRGGAFLTLALTVFDYDAGCAPVSGAQVDLWHCDVAGKYSDVSQDDTVGQTWLRGYQTTGSDGKVTFQTIFPGFYTGRATHIHVRVRSADTDFTTQIFFPEEQTAAIYTRPPYQDSTVRVKNADDSIYNEGARRGNVLVISLSGNNDTGWTGDGSIGLSAAATPEPADTRVAVTLRDVDVVRRRSGRRAVRIKLTAREALTLKADVRRHGRRLTRLAGEFSTGRYVVAGGVPRAVKAGPARVSMTFTDSAGNERTLHRAVHIPRKPR